MSNESGKVKHIQQCRAKSLGYIIECTGMEKWKNQCSADSKIEATAQCPFCEQLRLHEEQNVGRCNFHSRNALLNILTSK